jgi:hypothetical protein
LAAWSEDDHGFWGFVVQVEPRLRRGLMAAHGSDRGREAAAEAPTAAWERWDKVWQMANPVGYPFRIGQSRTRSRRRGIDPIPAQDSVSDPIASTPLLYAFEGEDLVVLTPPAKCFG